MKSNYQMDASSNDELIKAKRSIDLLYEVSQAITASKNLDGMLSYIVLLTALVTGSKICSLMLYDEKSKKLVIRATQSLSPDYRRKPPVPIGEGVSGMVFQSRSTMVVSDVTSDNRYLYPELAKRESLKSLVCIPLIVQGEAIGVLNCYTSERHEFTSDEIRLLTSVANQAALAIQSKEYLKQKEEVLEELETRKRVEKAKGILMARHNISENEAHRMLQQKSMNSRKSLRDIAEAIIVSNTI